ncbi:hypothetical protein ACWC9Q_29310 [Streptomyces sp. NPDC001142]
MDCPITYVTTREHSDTDVRRWDTLTTGPLRQGDAAGGHIYLTTELSLGLLRTAAGVVPPESSTMEASL